MKTLELLNVTIHNWSFKEFLAQLKQGVVVTPNIDHMVNLQKDRDFYQCYCNSDHIVCDSRIIQLMSKFLYPGRGIVEQIAGSDLFPAFCDYHKQNTAEVKVFLLGGTEDSVQVARQAINQRTESNIIIDGYSPPFGFEKDEAENTRIIEKINASGATVLAVGVGSPKQEKWIFQHRDKLANIAIYFAIGATIDFQAGEVKRAPRWMVKYGLEWFFRMTQDPKRLIKRYLIDDMPFFWLVLKQKLGIYKNPWRNT